MRTQVGIPVPVIDVLNVGGRTGGYTPGDPANGEYALDIQVHPSSSTSTYFILRHCLMLCSAALQSVRR